MVLNALAPRHHIGHLTLCEGAWQVVGECVNLEDVRKLSSTLERGLGIPIASASAGTSWRHASVCDFHAPLADPESVRERRPQW
jgi:maleate cis-trans isomerase